MSAPAIRANAHREPEKAPNQSKYAQKFGEVANAVSLGELLTFNSRHSEGYADLP
jgi:hypothetical protein